MSIDENKSNQGFINGTVGGDVLANDYDCGDDEPEDDSESERNDAEEFSEEGSDDGGE